MTRLGAESVEAKLTGLTLTPDVLSPDFDEYRFEYAASVEHTVGFITVAPEPAAADIAYDPAVDAIRASPGHQVELRDGQTRTITIKVTSPDGRKQQRYIIHATRAAAPSTDATLSQLVLVEDEASLNQTFDPYKGDYTAFVDHGTALFTVNPVANAKDDGATIAYSSLDSRPPVTDGHQFPPGTTLTITVTAPDRRTTKRYTIRVTEAAPPAADATLDILTLNNGGALPGV